MGHGSPPPPQVTQYLRDVKALAAEASPEGSLFVHDYAELLADEARTFGLYFARYRRTLADNPNALIDHQTYRGLHASTRTCISTGGLGLNFEDMRALFGPNPDPGHRLAGWFDEGAHRGLQIQLAIKLAADRVNLPQKLWPNHVRASCHKGLKHGRAPIGLRVYPEYYRSGKLLPYHGVPILTQRPEGPRLMIEPEICLRARIDCTRVVDDAGRTFFYDAR